MRADHAAGRWSILQVVVGIAVLALTAMVGFSAGKYSTAANAIALDGNQSINRGTDALPNWSITTDTTDPETAPATDLVAAAADAGIEAESFGG